MKILYGVQGTGNGHIARARMMAKHFSDRNIDVQYLFSGRPADKFFDMEPFGDYQLRHGLTFVTENGKISNLKTVMAARPLQFIEDVRALDLSEYDVILTDFEPVTAWAGRLKGKPVIGMGHQYAFGYPDVPERGVSAHSKFIMKYFAPVNHRLGLHWHHFNAPILPPIINPEETLKAGGKHIVVYLPFENQQQVTETLKTLPDWKFIQYSPELSDAEEGNVSLRKTSLHGFKEDLCSARGVICNSGFELLSECLHMGLAALTKPVSGQSEQLGNAAALEKLGHAHVMNNFAAQPIQHWLQNIPEQAPQQYPDVAAAICEWLLDGNWNNSIGLVESLWQRTGRAPLTA
ncbi:hypothetical protein IB286_05025 [Spongiibacter sp. KMU-158]|uniref:Glycosyltransferase n=1 Tax=Spongiibacter pelagi TaxID=2760804 RepID=A0A927GVG2_9GAMM|nr:MJ1255/VC2487 family glycosyltransferase [Spongiibacter pelagi]MBD2858365.1 hypothetical protein [Spongiibacter pelagi]